MRGLPFAMLAAMLVLATEGTAQSPDRSERGVYLTAFRSPATGVELRAGHVGAHLGFYPTIIGRDGERGNVNFIRAGATYYLKDHGTSAYVSPSLVWSLDSRWRNGALTEVGVRGRLYRRLNGRLGAAFLTMLDGEVRVNPTVGFDIELGAGR